MNIQADKLDLMKMILETENPEILELAKKLFTKGRKADFWNALSREQKQEIEAGIIEISNGETVEYESVMRKHRK